MIRRIALLACLAVICGCDKSGGGGGGDAAKTPSADSAAGKSAAAIRVAVVPKGTTHDFWKSIHAGAIKASRELGGVEVIFKGPDREDDRSAQISLMENLIAGDVQAIVLAPLDNVSLATPVKQATQAGIPVVIIDSGIDAEAGKDYVSFVSTDNYKGGELAGQRMVEVLGGKGRVLLLRYAEGSASTMEREAGFVAALSKAKEIELIDPKIYSGATVATAQNASENLLTAQEKPDGIFCPNESSTFGMLLALRSRGMAGKVKFVGFDASEVLVEALGNGELDGLIVQNPMAMGYLGVKAAVAHIRKEKVETRVDTGVTLVTKDNMAEPDVAAVLKPDLATYLNH